MSLVQVIANLVMSLAQVAADAVEAYLEGDPSKLDKVQDILAPSDRLRSDEVAALEREKTRRALGG